MSRSQNMPSVNAHAAQLVEDLAVNADAMRVRVSELENGTRIIDAGISVRGGLEVGRRIGEICLGGLGIVKLRASTEFENWSWYVDVHTSHPVIACLASQYAGWSLSHGEGKEAFNALGSGPARAMGSKEELFNELGYRDKSDKTCIVVEVDRIPPVAVAKKIADQCGIAANNLTIILTPTSSLSGCVQVVARVLETALHKAHALGFPLEYIVDGAGSAPVCPPSKDFMTAMSRTNDAILFAGQIHLFVEATDSEAEELANELPSCASDDYGQPFGDVFKAAGYDFYKIDPMLFSPARVAVTAMKSGKTYRAGRIDKELLNKSFSNKCG